MHASYSCSLALRLRHQEALKNQPRQPNNIQNILERILLTLDRDLSTEVSFFMSTLTLFFIVSLAFHCLSAFSGFIGEPSLTGLLMSLDSLCCPLAKNRHNICSQFAATLGRGDQNSQAAAPQVGFDLKPLRLIVSNFPENKFIWNCDLADCGNSWSKQSVTRVATVMKFSHQLISSWQQRKDALHL